MLGIDINPASINILEISYNRDQYCVERYSRALLADGLIDAGLINDIDKVVCSLKSLCPAQDIFPKQAIVAIPNACVINKIIQISAYLPEHDIEEQVYLEAEKYIPYPLNEINLDFKILGPSLQSDALLDTLIVAARTETINLRLELLHRAGFSAQIVDTETFAIERVMHVLVTKNSYNKRIAMFDVDLKYLHCYVFQNMKTIFLRDDILVVRSLDDPNTISGPFFESLLLQIKRALQFFTLNHHATVDQILLAGRTIFLPNFATFLEHHLNIPTQLTNPFEHMSFASEQIKNDINKDRASLMVACGLALRGCRVNTNG